METSARRLLGGLSSEDKTLIVKMVRDFLQNMDNMDLEIFEDTSKNVVITEGLSAKAIANLVQIMVLLTKIAEWIDLAHAGLLDDAAVIKIAEKTKELITAETSGAWVDIKQLTSGSIKKCISAFFSCGRITLALEQLRKENGPESPFFFLTPEDVMFILNAWGNARKELTL